MWRDAPDWAPATAGASAMHRVKTVNLNRVVEVIGLIFLGLYHHFFPTARILHAIKAIPITLA
jgi:hypothetical protein